MVKPLALALAAVLPVTAIATHWPEDKPPADGAMRTAARKFLASLSDDQRSQCLREFADAERTNWHFVPNTYKGVLLKDLDLDQRRLAHAMLQSVLSTQGYLRTQTIMRLEGVLRREAQEAGKRFEHRDPEKYWILICGQPRKDAPWSWRIQGHHLSLNFTASDGKIVAYSPAFFGTNPHEVRSGPFVGLRVLAAEEDLARRLLAALDGEQQKAALIADQAPRDIVAGPGKPAKAVGEAEGLRYADMSKPQRRMLMQLIREYARNFRGSLAQNELERIQADGLDEIRFAWAGSTEKGPKRGHYFRIHGPSFLIEYDNVQNDANHVHTAWRDLSDDFGVDWLREHWRKDHKDR